MAHNQFEHLRIPQFEDSEPIREYKNIILFNDKAENISLLIAKIIPDKIVLGYNILFLNGRKADRLPSLEYGYFKSENDAILYMLGYIKQFNTYFSKEAIQEIDYQIARYQQQNIF